MNTVEIIMAIIGLYVCLHALFVLFYIYFYSYSDTDFPIFFTPEDLYQHSKMNAVGCLIIYLLLIALIPIFTLGGIIKWLFTVGR